MGTKKQESVTTSTWNGNLFVYSDAVIKLPKYRCAKGHEWETNYYQGWGEEMYSYCPLCLLEWYRQNISPAIKVEDVG